MPTYQRNFKKIVWGYQQVEAEDMKEAMLKFDDDDFDDEFDNKSDYEFEDVEQVDL